MKWTVVIVSNLCRRLHFFSQDSSMRWSLGEESLCLPQCSWTSQRVLGFFCQGEASDLQQNWCRSKSTVVTSVGGEAWCSVLVITGSSNSVMSMSYEICSCLCPAMLAHSHCRRNVWFSKGPAADHVCGASTPSPSWSGESIADGHG